MFRSFAAFNYRIWFIGAVVSNVGAWMQSTAQSWVVLTELTPGDAGAMGITMALQFAPPLLLVSVTGWVADRFDRRKLIMLTQSIMLLLAVALGVLVLTGVMTLPIMYAFALALGILTAFDNPARQAFVPDLVSRENASNAVALNAASFNTARLIGPAVAGVLIVAVGSGWVFLVNSVTFLAMIGALALMRTKELAPRLETTGRSRLSEGFRYVAGRRDLVVIFTMVFLLGAFGLNFPIFASTMALEFDREADGFGFLTSILAIGSLVGALLAARRAQPRMRIIVFAAGMFSLASLASALAPTFETYAIALVFVGFSVVTMLTTANGYVQTTTDPSLRGRVLALYMAILLGGTPVGAPIVGALANEFGPRTAIGMSVAASLIACAVGVTWMLTSGRVHRHPSKRFRLTLDDTRPIALPVPAEFSDEVAGTTPIPLPHPRDPHAARSAGSPHPRPSAG